MKRRNAECGKLRRPLKRNKITEGIYGSTFLYLKFLGIWAFVLLLDFILEFRFEYLWPLWLLLRSIYDSYRYQGLAFSVFFVFIAFTSDMICLLFIPVHWLFFAASTYVWVQFVWHTDRGICLPTVSLWLLFVYIEASVRLRELRSALPFHLDLCRPFAAHCIGYPVVTLGFGFKSYVGYRMRLRKQKDVQKENDFYMQLLQQALPPEQQTSSLQPDKTKAALSGKSDEPTLNGVKNKGSPAVHTKDGGGDNSSKNKESRKHSNVNNASVNSSKSASSGDSNYLETNSRLSQRIVNDYDGTKENLANEQVQAKKQNIGGSSSTSSSSQRQKNQSSAKENSSSSQGSKKPKTLSSKVENKEKEKDTNLNAEVPNGVMPQSVSREEKSLKCLESDIKRLKADLQASRQTESVLRSDLNSKSGEEQRIKSELDQLKRDNESLQTKLHNLVTQKQQDKQSLAKLEKNLKSERDSRSSYENQLKEERKSRKAEEAAAARAVALATANTRTECSDTCRARQLDQDKEIHRLRGEQHGKDERLRDLEMKAEQLHERQESQGKTELLMSALMAMQDKTAKLETSLSAETRLKLDLFSALGDARRQMEICQGQLMKKEAEIHDLKSKIAEVMAVMPPGSYPGSSPPASGVSSTPRYFCNVEDPPVSTAAAATGGGGATPNSGSDGGNSGGGGSGGGASSASSGSPVPTPEPQQMGPWGDQGKSVLDPNAACYRPKSN